MPTHLRTVAIARLGASALVLVALGLTLTDASGLVPERVIDLMGYYTLQANFLGLAVWVSLAFASTRAVSPKAALALEYGRAFATANLVMVAAIYWSMIAPLGLEAGTQLVIVMIISHVITPAYATFDYLVVGARTPLPLRGWWWFFAIPTAWLVTAIARAYAGGWVPYDYLDPARGLRAIAGTVSWHGLVFAGLTLAALRVRAWRTVPPFLHAPKAADLSAPLDAGLR